MKSILNFYEAEGDYEFVPTPKPKQVYPKFDIKNAAPVKKIPSYDGPLVDEQNAYREKMAARVPYKPVPFNRENVITPKPVQPIPFNRENAITPKPVQQITKNITPQPSIKSALDNNTKLMRAKADAVRAAADYKASHPGPPVSAPPNAPAAPVSAPASKPFSLNNNIDQAIAHRVPPGVASTPVTSVSPIDTSNMPSRFDFKAAAEAGTAVNATKTVGKTFIDKVKEETPNILNRGAQVMSKLGDVTGYGK